MDYKELKSLLDLKKYPCIQPIIRLVVVRKFLMRDGVNVHEVYLVKDRNICF